MPGCGPSGPSVSIPNKMAQELASLKQPSPKMWIRDKDSAEPKARQDKTQETLNSEKERGVAPLSSGYDSCLFPIPYLRKLKLRFATMGFGPLAELLLLRDVGALVGDGRVASSKD